MKRTANEILRNLEKQSTEKIVVKVEWDLEDTEFEGMPYRKALSRAGLPNKVILPSSLVRELDGGDQEDQISIISDFLSDEYDYTHLGWEFVKGGFDL